MRIDLHTHSSVSDGTDAPGDLVRAAREAGLDVIALCDHDTFAGLDEATSEGPPSGIRVLRGIEISGELDGGSVHLLGYGCRADDQALGLELARIRTGRTGRIPAMLARLAALGMPIGASDLAPFVGSSPSVGRPHVADAMVALGYVADRREAFDSWLADGGPAFVDRYSAPLAQAVDLVHAAGGAAVIAHPWGRGSREHLTAQVLTRLAAASGLDGIEIDHTDHDQAARGELRVIADAAGLLVTGSSDYHGLGKINNPLGCETTSPTVFQLLVDRILARGGRPW